MITSWHIQLQEKAFFHLFLWLRNSPLYLCACSVVLVVSDSATPWTVVCQAPLSMEFSRREYWSGLPCLSPGDLPNPGIEPVSPVSPALQADSLPLSHPESPLLYVCMYMCVCVFVSLCVFILYIYIFIYLHIFFYIYIYMPHLLFPYSW